MSRIREQHKLSRPRPRPIGPAFAVCLVAAFALLGFRWWQEKATPRRPPLVESRVVPSGEAPTRFTPEITVLLAESSRLDLTAEQWTSLEALAREWKQAAGPLRRDLDGESKRFREFADREANSGGGNLTELQRRAEPALELGRELANLKLQFWRRALEVLSPRQREAAEELRRNALTPGKEGE